MMFLNSVSPPIAISFAMLSIATILATLEQFSLLREYEPGGAFHWQAYQASTLAPRVASILGRLFGRSGVAYLLSLQIVCGLIVALSIFGIFRPAAPLGLLGILLITVLLRYICPYGVQGSDSMLVIVALGLLVAEVYAGSPWGNAGIWYIAAQSCLSYFAAGAAKLITPMWRNGQALQHVFRTQVFGHSRIDRLLSRRPLRLLGSWVVISFEIAFPIVLIAPQKLLLLFLFVALAFHIFNAFFMGLNNFIWSFPATYPAIWLCNRAITQWVHRSL
jgi:hypothetical protein